MKTEYTKFDEFMFKYSEDFGKKGRNWEEIELMFEQLFAEWLIDKGLLEGGE